MKVAAIVPALDEEKNIGNVLKALLYSKELQEVIVAVDSRSKDKTAQISRELGARVIIVSETGKGGGMREALKSTDADIILFCDADLIGFTSEHVSLLVSPVLKDEAVMAVGIRERRGSGKFAQALIKIDPLLAIAGERALRRWIFEKIPPDLSKGFMVETALNYYCYINNLPVRYVKLKGLSIVIKEKKWNFLRGFVARIKMVGELIKIRALILSRKNDFKNL